MKHYRISQHQFPSNGLSIPHRWGYAASRNARLLGHNQLENAVIHIKSGYAWERTRKQVNTTITRNLLPATKKDPEKRLRELLTELDKGIFIKPGKSTLAEYLEVWLNDYCKPNLAVRTCDLYEYLYDKHIKPTLGKISLVELRPMHLQHLYAEKQSSGLSGRTVQLIHVTLHKALKKCG